MEINDYLVVGSGCCGAVVAKTLAEKGVKVCMLDAGITQTKFNDKPDSSFVSIRNSAQGQEDYLLGKQFESLGSIRKKNPVHLTPNRMFTTKDVDRFLVWDRGDFHPVESLAKGGLGNAWGLGSYVYSKQELALTGLPVAEMQEAYRWVAERIGISGGQDDSAEFANNGLFTPEDAIPLDFNGARLWDNCIKKAKSLKQTGITIGRTPLAVSTQSDKNGQHYQKNDLDFYETGITSAFRPINLINLLQQNGSLHYILNQLVLSYWKENEFIRVETLDIKTNEKKSFYCRKLILAAGALGSARIVMRSSNIERLPLLCNPYTYIPSLQPKLLGAANTGYQTGLAQLSLYYDSKGDHSEIAMGSLYSYRSLMGFRLMREFPLDFKSGMNWVKLLQPALNITGIFHPEFPGPQKFMQRIPDPTNPIGDKFTSSYVLSDQENQRIAQSEKHFKRALRAIGTFPLKVQRNKHGASIHYGGTLPFTDHTGDTPGLHQDGRLQGTQNVFIADGSGFRFLSGKGLTLTLMAYAHYVAGKALED